MSLPDRNNPYGFEPFVREREAFDYYGDDPFLQRVVAHFAGSEAEGIDERLREYSRSASGAWRTCADVAARPENRPLIEHYDGHGRRVDRLIRPLETLEYERGVFGSKLFSRHTPMWERLTRIQLSNQNGEAGINCPIACTEGLVALLDRFADTAELRSIHEHLTEGRDGHVAIGAQFLSEIQGGSDVPANRVEAVPDGDVWRIHGRKFFCSVAHADYAVVTAKPAGSEQVGLFVVPAYLPGQDLRNGCRIHRIKWKMGTGEMITAEIEFDGALGYRVGPLDRGLANVVGIVLTLSRLNVGISAAGAMTRAAREALQYARYREAFGEVIGSFPMVRGQLADMERTVQRSTAGIYSLYRDYLGLDGGLKGGLNVEDPLEERRHRFRVRELIMLQKIAVAWDATDLIRSAMSVFGGHGVMEDFSALPRLYRDAAVNELWEGPRNVLLSQIHRDLQRASDWYPAEEFVRDLAGADSPLAREFAELVAHPSLMTGGDETIEVCRRWDRVCQELCWSWQDLALAEVLAD